MMMVNKIMFDGVDWGKLTDRELELLLLAGKVGAAMVNSDPEPMGSILDEVRKRPSLARAIIVDADDFLGVDDSKGKIGADG